MSSWRKPIMAVLVRPGLWPTALRQGIALRRPGAHLSPDPAYVRFRSLTQYGGSGEHVPSATDVLSYLRWLKAWRRSVATRR
jgi:hypothetical protein